MSPALRGLAKRFRSDRLIRWTAYGAVPIVWLAVALDPGLLVLLPLLVASLWVSFRWGPAERSPDLDAEWLEL